MLVPFVLFLIVVIWALVQGDMYAKEAIILGSVWLICLAALFLLPGSFGIYFVVPITVVDIYLVVKLIGNPKAF